MGQNIIKTSRPSLKANYIENVMNNIGKDEETMEIKKGLKYEKIRSNHGIAKIMVSHSIIVFNPKLGTDSRFYLVFMRTDDDKDN